MAFEQIHWIIFPTFPEFLMKFGSPYWDVWDYPWIYSEEVL